MQKKSHRGERLLLLAVLLVFLAALKASFDPAPGRGPEGGGYHYQVARHVAEGDGLMTSVSLHHQGLEALPHRTNVPPIWPLALGWTGKAVSLERAAARGPELLYLLDLVLLYLVANRLMGRLQGRGDPSALGGGVLTLGHLAVLLLGTSPVFFTVTSLPLAEPLGIALVLATLLAVDRVADPGWKLWAPVAGGLAGLALLTIPQAAGLAVGVVLALALAGVRWRAFLVAALLAALALGSVLLPWLLELASFVEPFDPRALLSIGAYRETPELAPFRWTVPAESWWQLARDRLGGLLVAFDPRAADSYAASFGPAAWLAPLALVALAVRPRRLLEALRPRSLTVTATVLAGLAMVAPLHLLHLRHPSEWLFGDRQGLAFVLLLMPALGYLLLRPSRVLRAVALALVLIAFATGSVRTTRLLAADPGPTGLAGPEAELAVWLDGQRPRPVVLTTRAEALTLRSRAGFHWTECRESPDQTRRLLESVEVAYVLIYAGERECSFGRDVLRLPVAARFGDGDRRITAYRARSLFRRR